MLQADPSKVSSRAKKRGLPQVSLQVCSSPPLLCGSPAWQAPCYSTAAVKWSASAVSQDLSCMGLCSFSVMLLNPLRQRERSSQPPHPKAVHMQPERRMPSLVSHLCLVPTA